MKLSEAFMGCQASRKEILDGIVKLEEENEILRAAFARLSGGEYNDPAHEPRSPEWGTPKF